MATLVNLISNGSFESGTTGWNKNGSVSVVSSASKFGSYAGYRAVTSGNGGYLGQNFTSLSNHIYYYSIWCKNTCNAEVVCDIANSGGGIWFPASSNDFVRGSSRLILTDSTTHTANIGWGSANNGNGVWLDGALLTDLTAAFGVGNEPYKEWCDANISYFQTSLILELNKKMYTGVAGVARKAAKGYIGVGGVARKVTKAYIGVDGVARRFY